MRQQSQVWSRAKSMIKSASTRTMAEHEVPIRGVFMLVRYFQIMNGGDEA